jgi:hypothetical protein
MEGWLVAPATEYLKVRYPCRELAALPLGLLTTHSGLLKK